MQRERVIALEPGVVEQKSSLLEEITEATPVASDETPMLDKVMDIVETKLDAGYHLCNCSKFTDYCRWRGKVDL